VAIHLKGDKLDGHRLKAAAVALDMCPLHSVLHPETSGRSADELVRSGDSSALAV